MSRTSKQRRDRKKKRRGSKAKTAKRPRRLFKVLPPWALQEEDGGRMVLLKLNDKTCGLLFDKSGRPVGPDAPLEKLAGEGNLWSDAPPNYLGVRDWFSEAHATNVGLSEMDQWRYDLWTEAYESNRDYVKLSADAVEREDVCYIVAEGPSVFQNGFHLADITRGVTLAVNRVPKLFNLDFDYWLAIDFKFDFADNTGPYPNTTALLDVVANPALREIGWKEVRWFVPDYDISVYSHPVYDRVRAAHPWLPRYDVGLNCTFQAMAWACLSLLGSPRGVDRDKIIAANKGKTIVLVGFDHCFTYMQARAGEWLMADQIPLPDLRFMSDHLGRLVLTNDVLYNQSLWMTAVCFFAREAGIRVINATEGGLIKTNCEHMPLAQAVEELNAGGKACT